MYVPLCEPWPLPPSGCPDLTGDPAMVDEVLLAASEQLFELSGAQFGACSVLLRPCRQACGPALASSWWWQPGWVWPSWGLGLTEFWLDAACGRCTGGCGCNSADTLLLSDPVQSITQVLVDGVVLPPSGYALYNGRQLVRTDGATWPLCQDWTVPVSGSGAWSVEAVFQRPVPASGRLALGQLAREFLDFCTSGRCSLPAYTTTLTRQGVQQQFPSIKELRDVGAVGLLLVDRFLDAFNPDGIRGGRGAQIWNPDDFDEGPRRPGGAW